MKHSAEIAGIRELCSLGLTGELLIPALLEALHRVIPSSRNLFDWVNAEGRIQRYYFEGPIDHKAARLYFDEFHNKREAEAMPKFVDVIRGDAMIRSAEELDHRQFFESALYNEIWRPQRLHYRLEAIVRGRDAKPLGSLVLYREERERIFSKADEQTLEALVPYVAHGLLHGTDRRIDYDRSDRCSVRVNLDPGGRIAHLSRNAHKVLLLAHGDISPASAARDPTTENFPTLTLLHRQLSRPGNLPEALCALTLTNNWGQFEFRADRMEPVGGDDPAWTVVTIEHLVPREVQVLDVLEAYPLSIAQKKVCALLMQRLSQPQIAERLEISTHTVVDHIRKIYLKLDVHSVEELRSRFGAHSRS